MPDNEKNYGSCMRHKVLPDGRIAHLSYPLWKELREELDYVFAFGGYWNIMEALNA